ncbi:hypothetical protein [Roseomonas sp. BN140053]|uniref:hypothetical protein n=1 Tax=Roseomonas sp. BN140053 TaxID=3391898 RepID=UPI0039EB11D7
MSDLSAENGLRFPATSPALRRPHRLGALALGGLRIGFWGVVQFALTLAEMVAEVLAPLLLVAGFGWWAALNVLGSLSQAPEFQAVLAELPHRLRFGDHWLTPAGLIWNGVALMAVVAACRTLNTIIVKET